MESNFNISVSTKAYPDKNSIEWSKVSYQPCALNIHSFIGKIKSGHCFCHLFNTVRPTFNNREKTKNNFKEAWMVFVDIDDCDISMREFTDRLTTKPTLSYTTPNNHTEKSHFLYRFRLCYILHTPIKELNTYAGLYNAILRGILKDIPGYENKDNCGRDAAHVFSGNATCNCEVLTFDRFYSVTDFDIEATPQQERQELTPRELKAPTNIEIQDHEFFSDLNILPPTDLIAKYRTRYPYFDRTELEYRDGYAILPPNYTEIYRQSRIDNFIKDNGEVITFSRAKKLRDGDGRKRKLFLSALIRKQIKPDVTFEHLLFNLVIDRLYYNDNSDHELSNQKLIEMAQRAINTPLEEIKIPYHRPKDFEVDKGYCQQHGITPNEMKNRVRKILTDQSIGELYDCSKSIKENLTVLKQNGLKIGKSRLYQWCHENHIETKGMPLYKAQPYWLNPIAQRLQELINRYYFAVPDGTRAELFKEIEETANRLAC